MECAAVFITKFELIVYSLNGWWFVDMKKVIDEVGTQEQLTVHRRDIRKYILGKPDKKRGVSTAEQIEITNAIRLCYDNTPNNINLTTRINSQNVGLQNIRVLDSFISNRLACYWQAAERLLHETPNNNYTVDAFINAVYPFPKTRNPIYAAKILEYYYDEELTGHIPTTLSQVHSTIQLFLQQVKIYYSTRTSNYSDFIRRGAAVGRPREPDCPRSGIVGGYAARKDVAAARIRRARDRRKAKFIEARHIILHARARARSRASMSKSRSIGQCRNA